MQIPINKRFLKDLVKISSRDRARIEMFVLKESEQYEGIEQMGNMEKLQEYDMFYRARFNNYRVRVRYENNGLTAERVLHCREIYQKYIGCGIKPARFPKTCGF